MEDDVARFQPRPVSLPSFVGKSSVAIIPAECLPPLSPEDELFHRLLWQENRLGEGGVAETQS